MKYEDRVYQLQAAERGIAFLLAQGKKPRNGIIYLPTGCHAKGTEILMASGAVKHVEDITKGDNLMGPDGRPRKVLALCRGREAMYKISPRRGGSPFTVNANHVLSLVSTNEGRSKYPCYQRGGEVLNISVRDYLRKSTSWRHLRKLYRSPELPFFGQALPVKPWVVGVILGDGCTRNGRLTVTSADQEIIDEVSAYVGTQNMRVRVSSKKNTRAVSLHLIKADQYRNGHVSSLLTENLRGLGLVGKGSSEKFIPSIYQTAEPKERLELLAGLMDTDGSLVRGGFDYISKSEQLAKDVAFVARSLGLTASFSKCEKGCQGGFRGIYFRVHVSGNVDRVPCRIARKKASPRGQKKDPLRTGFTIERLAKDNFYGFCLDGDHLYLTADFFVHHNSGKSVVQSIISRELAAKGHPIIVFQPSIEILKQNYQKFLDYGYRPEIFSASAGSRAIGDVTLATIGSVFKHPEWFEDFRFGIVDEAHTVGYKDNSHIVQETESGFYHRELGLVTPLRDQEGVRKGRVKVVDEDGVEAEIPRPKKSMYKSFVEQLPHMAWLGMTASPWRLETNAMGSMLKVITRTRPRIWHDFVHYTQYKELFDAGYLSKMEYFQIAGFKSSKVAINSSGSDYDAKSLQLHLWEKLWETKSGKQVHFPDKLTEIVSRLLDAGRRNVLVFTSSVRESEYLAEQMKGACAVVTGSTDPDERNNIAEDFKRGDVRVVSNCAVWVLGFDFPGLETVVDAAGTMSLTRYDQKLGRTARVSPEKASSYVVDLVGGFNQFGRLEDRTLYCQGNSRWDVFGRPGGKTEKQLTSVWLSGAPGCCPKCGARKWMAYYPKSQKWLPLSAPPAGSRANVIVKEEGRKKVCEIVERGNPEATAALHFTVCAKFAAMRKAA